MLGALIQQYFKEGAAFFRLPGGRTVGVGGAGPDAPLQVRILTHAWAARIASRPALDLGEAYMAGGLILDRGDIFDLLALIGRNFRHRRRQRSGSLARLGRWANQANGRLTSRRNVAAHYEFSLELYRLFLDDDLQYSCAVFESPEADLETAQRAKKRRLIDKLLIRSGDTVLDIGCGFGGLGLSLAEAGAQVTGVTLSNEQLSVARARAAARGLDRRARFELADYRDVEGRFDRIISVGMLEHVGLPQMQSYFDRICALLAPDGIAVVHAIGRMLGPNTTQPWIARHIFPGGYVPALSEVLPAIERSGLWVTDIEILRLHYARTIAAWRARFAARRHEAERLYDERFCRMWEYYLAASEVAFLHGDHMNFQIQLSKSRQAVPLLRDYLYRGPDSAAPSDVGDADAGFSDRRGASIRGVGAP